MEIRFYTPELNLIGIMENQTSLLWTRKFYEPGSFQLITPITDYNVRLCQLGNIISIDGADEAAVIECVTIRQEHSRRIITAVGRMLSSYFDRRLIRPANTSDRPNAYKYEGTVEGAMRELVSRLDKPIPLVRLGALNNFEETVGFQATYKNLLNYLVKLSNHGNIGFRLIPDFTAKTLTFETYKGVDHSIRQSERTRVEFSEEFQNISTLKYQEDDRSYKNTFYIGGEGEGDAREFFVLGYNDKEGLERREVLYNANQNSSEFTMYEYREPTFTQELPTEKLTNIPVYGNGRPVYAVGVTLTDPEGVDHTYWGNQPNVSVALGGDPAIPYSSHSDVVREFGISWSGDWIVKNPVASNGWKYNTERKKKFLYYEKVVTGYRDETDEEFQARVDAYYRARERWIEDVDNYQKKFSQDWDALEKKKNNIFNKHPMIINFEPVVNPYGNYEYRKYWDLGDIVTVKKESWGLDYDLMITEVQEIYEHGLMMIAPTLGDVIPETIDWEDR